LRPPWWKVRSAVKNSVGSIESQPKRCVRRRVGFNCGQDNFNVVVKPQSSDIGEMID
jgi:hypothetical protein